MPGNNLIFKLLTFQYNSGTRSCKKKNNNRTPVLTAYLLENHTRALHQSRSFEQMIRERESFTCRFSSHRDTRKRDKSNGKETRREIYIYRVGKKNIFDHDFDHAPSPARGYNFVDFHFTPGQQMSRGTAVFDKSSNRISSPVGTSCFPALSRLLSFFFPSFSLSFDTFNKGKTLYQIPFHCDLFYLVHERVYTFYFSNRYNF